MSNSKCEVPEGTQIGPAFGLAVVGVVNFFNGVIKWTTGSTPELSKIDTSQAIMWSEVDKALSGIDRTNMHQYQAWVQGNTSNISTALDTIRNTGDFIGLSYVTTSIDTRLDNLHQKYNLTINQPDRYTTQVITKFEETVMHLKDRLQRSTQGHVRLKLLNDTLAGVEKFEEVADRALTMKTNDALSQLLTRMVDFHTSNLGNSVAYRNEIQKLKTEYTRDRLQSVTCDAKIARSHLSIESKGEFEKAFPGKFAGTVWSADDLSLANTLISKSLAEKMAGVDPANVSADDLAVAWAFRSTLETKENGWNQYFPSWQTLRGITNEALFTPHQPKTFDQVRWKTQLKDGRPVPQSTATLRIKTATKGKSAEEMNKMLGLFGSWDPSVVEEDGTPKISIDTLSDKDAGQNVPLEVRVAQNANNPTELAQLFCEAQSVPDVLHPALGRAKEIAKTQGIGTHNIPGFGGYGKLGKNTAQRMLNDVRTTPKGDSQEAKKLWAAYTLHALSDNDFLSNSHKLLDAPKNYITSNNLWKNTEAALQTIANNGDGDGENNGKDLWNELSRNNKVFGVVNSEAMMNVATAAEVFAAKDTKYFEKNAKRRKNLIRQREMVWAPGSPHLTQIELVGSACYATDKARAGILADNKIEILSPEATNAEETGVNNASTILVTVVQKTLEWSEAFDRSTVIGYLMISHLLLVHFLPAVGIQFNRGWIGAGAFAIYKMVSTFGSDQSRYVVALSSIDTNEVNALWGNTCSLFVPFDLEKEDDGGQIQWQTFFKGAGGYVFLLFFEMLESMYQKEVVPLKEQGRINSAVQKAFANLPVVFWWLYVVSLSLLLSQDFLENSDVALLAAFISPEAAMSTLDLAFGPTTKVSGAFGKGSYSVDASIAFRSQFVEYALTGLKAVWLLQSFGTAYTESGTQIAFFFLSLIVTANGLKQDIEKKRIGRLGTNFIREAPKILNSIPESGVATSISEKNIVNNNYEIQEKMRLLLMNNSSVKVALVAQGFQPVDDYDVLIRPDGSVYFNSSKIKRLKLELEADQYNLTQRLNGIVNTAPNVNTSYAKVLGDGASELAGNQRNFKAAKNSFAYFNGFSVATIVGTAASTVTAFLNAGEANSKLEIVTLGIQLMGIDLLLSYLRSRYSDTPNFGTFDYSGITNLQERNADGQITTYTPEIKGLQPKGTTVSGLKDPWTLLWPLLTFTERHKQDLASLKIGLVDNISEFNTNWENIASLSEHQWLKENDFLIVILRETEDGKVKNYTRSTLEKNAGCFLIRFEESDLEAATRFKTKFGTIENPLKIVVDNKAQMGNQLQNAARSLLYPEPSGFWIR